MDREKMQSQNFLVLSISNGDFSFFDFHGIVVD